MTLVFVFLPMLCAVFVEHYTPVRKRTAAPMFVSCTTADRSRWCAQLARNQCHRDIEELVSPLQVIIIIIIIAEMAVCFFYILYNQSGGFYTPGHRHLYLRCLCPWA